MIAVQKQVNWAAVGVIVGAILGAATLVVASVTLVVTRHLKRLAVSDSATQAAIQAAAEATRDAALGTRDITELARQTQELTYAEGRMDARRNHLWGVVECVEELEVLVGRDLTMEWRKRAILLSARMKSFLERLTESLRACRELSTMDETLYWNNGKQMSELLTQARDELRVALRGESS